MQPAKPFFCDIEQLLSSITSILIGVTSGGVINYWNSVAESTFRLLAPDVLNRPFVDCGVLWDASSILSRIADCKNKNRPIALDDVLFQKADGEKGILGFTIIPIRATPDVDPWFLLYGADITKRKQLDRLKDEFVSTVSHELRTPLAIIKEGISLILDGISGPVNKRQEEILLDSRENIDRLARIIDSLLNISKIEAGRLELKKELLDLVGLAQRVAAAFESRARDKRIELRIYSSRESIEIYADNDKMTQVLTNLVGNAIKFTDNGVIEISITERDNQIMGLVSDTGPGISKEDLPKLFTKFQQFGRPVGGGEKGTGLGLVITKAIIELHHGQIWAESVLGKGTQIFFMLPKYVKEVIVKDLVRYGMKLAKKNESWSSLLMGVVAHFEELKKTTEPEKLNAVLEEMENLLMGSLRQTGDVHFKQSGEFAVVLTDCNKKSISSVRERLKKLLQDYLKTTPFADTIKLQFGCATYPDDADSEETLIAFAKKDLSN